MTDTADLTLAILRDIRDAVRLTNGRLDDTNTRLEEMNSRLGETNTRLEEMNTRQEEMNTRIGHVETTLLELAEQQRFVVRALGTGRGRDRRLEQEVDSLRARVDALEERVGPV